jgi:putative NADPH-quinone reductase
MASAKVLWYLFHPNFDQSRGNRVLHDSIKDLPNLTIVEMYAKYPDGKIDVAGEQDLLRAHDLIVFQHPFYWYSCPPLMKQWIDDVLEYGFAYPPKEGKELHGKHWLSVMTTGGPEWSYRAGGYNNYSISELLRPIQQTANLCGMKWVAPFVVHSVLPGDYEGIKAQADNDLLQAGERLRKMIESFNPDERHTLEPLVAPHFLVPIS